MNESNLQYFKDTKIQFIDGDRGDNYPSKSEFFESGHCIFLNTENVTENGFDLSEVVFISKEKDLQLASGKLQRGDIVLTSRGTLGNVAFYGDDIPHEDIRINSGMLIVRTDSQEYSPYYLYIFLRSNIFQSQCDQISSGSVQNQLPVHALENASILRKDLATQHKIEQVIRCLDEKIELNIQINTELESMAKLIYNHWFIQFDFPDANGKPYKSSGGKMIYNKTLKSEIPKNWHVANLKNNTLSEMIIPKVCEFEGEKIYLSTSEVEKNNINFNAENVSFFKRPSRANMQPVKNSVWFAKMKKSKKVLYFGDYSEELLDQLILSTGFAGLKCKKNSLEYVWEFINNDRFENTKDRLSGGATQKAINNDAMASIPFLEPTNAVLDEYQLSVKKIYMKIYNNQIENKFLCDLREWLLPMLMNEQVKIK